MVSMDTLRLYVVTWNVATRPPDANVGFDDLLGFTNNTQLPDMFVVGLQEVKSQVQNLVLDTLFEEPWTKVFRMKLAERNYVKMKTVRLQGLLLNIFVQRRHVLSVRDMTYEVVRTGLRGLWGNKGGVAIRLNLSGVNICIVNTHLPPHDEYLEARIEQYNDIVQQMRFPKHKPTEMIFFHDYVVWLGDQNFRIDESVSREEVVDRIKKDDLEWLLERDQLKSVMKAGRAFNELTEAPFRFPPTYKFVFNSMEYDAKRRPAWTDRILYRVTQDAYENLTLSIESSGYTWKPDYFLSDHKPVVNQLKIKTMADYVDRVAEFNFIPQWTIDHENHIAVNLPNDVTPKDYDWIGIFKADYSSLDDYISFLYINPRTSDDADRSQIVRPEKRIPFSFPDNSIKVAGEYCLLYVTEDTGSVLAISNTFQATSTGSDRSLTPKTQRRHHLETSKNPSVPGSPNIVRQRSPASRRKQLTHSDSDS